MAWLAVDEDGKEIVYSCKPEKSEEFGAHLVYFDNCSVVLPHGSIKKLIRRKLTWEDEPVEI